MNCNQCKVDLPTLKREWMVMLRDDLWESICQFKREIICDECIELRLGRKIKEEDLMKPSPEYISYYGLTEIACNSWYKQFHMEKFQ